MIWQTDSVSSEQTERLGALLAAQLKPPVAIELIADLGGGKTTFVKGIAKGLGCEEQITSPTFTISREYACREGIFLHHFDFYRLQEAGVVAETLTESIHDSRVITIVEWGDIVHNVLPPETLRVSLKAQSGDANVRSLTFSYTEIWQPVIEALENDWSRA